MAHGFGASPDGPLGTVARKLCDFGLAAFAFDFRRFGVSDGEPRYVLKIDDQLEDWAAAIAFVRSQADVDPDRTGLWGSSLSGGQVISVAARDAQVAGAVAQVPYCDGFALARAAGLRHNFRVIPAMMRDLFQDALGLKPHLIQALGPPNRRALLCTRADGLYEEILRSVPPAWSNRIAARSLLELYRFRPILEAKEVSCPLLVVVTYQDRVAPPATAIRAAHDLPYAEMALFSAQHFDLYSGTTFDRVIETEAKFLAHHLAADAPALGASAEGGSKQHRPPTGSTF
jgi:pimeloyl-ACP methyl ester carboxylesterase